MVTEDNNAQWRRRQRAKVVAARHAKMRRVVVAELLQKSRTRKSRHANPEKPCRRFGDRLNWDEYVAGFASDEFKRAYRIDLATFNLLLHSIEEELEKNSLQANRSSSGPVEPAVRLSMALRYLAGGSVHDIYRLHKVAKETMYDSVWMVVDAINNHPDYQIAFPFDDEEKMAHMEAGFRSKSAGQLHTGCVGAIDGIFIKMRYMAIILQ